MHPVQYVIQKLNQQQSIYLNSSLVSVWKNLTHGHTQQNKNRHRRRKWKMKVPPLGDQAEGAALWAHTPPFLTTKQPEQLAAPLEPGGGKKSCKENGGDGVGGSQTQRNLVALVLQQDTVLLCGVSRRCMMPRPFQAGADELQMNNFALPLDLSVHTNSSSLVFVTCLGARHRNKWDHYQLLPW